MKKQANICKYCGSDNNECKRKKIVCKQLYDGTLKASRIRGNIIVPQKPGIYSIKDIDNNIIYVGMSSRSVRKRLLAHTGGYDGQAIGRFLKYNCLEDYGVSWVLEEKAECLESHFIDCVTKEQGRRPVFNLTRGNRCKTKEE